MVIENKLNIGILWESIESDPFDSSTTNTVGHTATQQYDLIDRLEIVTDPLGRVTKTVYDDVGQVVEVRRGVGTALEQAYVTNTWSDNGTLKSVKDANANITTYQYDTHNRLILTTLPDGSTVQQNNLDQRGLPDEIINREGQSTSFEYDNLGRLTFKDAPAPEADVTYQYDLAGKPTLISDTHGNSASYQYDAAGRQTELTDHNSRTVSYDYDQASKLKTITYPGSDNFQLSYQYDTLSRLSHIREGSETGNILAQYHYNSLNQRSSQEINGNVAAIHYQQDKAGRLTDLGFGTDPNNTKLDIGYDYDAASQLTRRFYTDGLYAWQNTDTLITDYGTPNTLNQYPNATYTGSTSQTINYDQNGNLTSFNGQSYHYNSMNQLTQVVTETDTATDTIDYGYNPQGQRTEKISTQSGHTTHYFYSGSNNIAEYKNGALTARYLYGPGTDEILAQINYTGTQNNETESTRSFYYSDGLGSIIASLNETGAVTQRYTYSPFGINGQSNDHTDHPFAYTGQRYDSDTGLYYYKARYYHASLGRFLSTDPVGYDDQMNLYAYVANRPMGFRDPSGESSYQLGLVFDAEAGSGARVEVGAYIVTDENGDWDFGIYSTETAIASSNVGLSGGIQFGYGPEITSSESLSSTSGGWSVSANTTVSASYGQEYTSAGTIQNFSLTVGTPSPILISGEANLNQTQIYFSNESEASYSGGSKK